MKKLALIFLLLFVAASISFAQTVAITPKKTVYTRRGKVASKEKRTFTVTYPIVSGAMPLAAKKKLAETISYWRVFDTTLAENMSDYDWLYEMIYSVNYNKDGILDVALTMSGSGAYPDESTNNLVVDLKTGEQIKFAAAFKAESLDEFARLVDAKLKTEVKEIIKSIDEDQSRGNTPEENDALKEQLNALNFAPETFDEFSISDQGVTIIYDAAFPHVIQALEPNGRYFFAWAEAKPFVKPDGLLGKFVR